MDSTLIDRIHGVLYGHAVGDALGLGAESLAKHNISMYRIDDLNRFIKHLKASGIKIERTEEAGHGLFAYIQDPEGNKIELFQEKND